MKLIRIYTSINYSTLLNSTRVIYQSRCSRKICQFFRGFIIVDEGTYNETMLRMTTYPYIESTITYFTRKDQTKSIILDLFSQIYNTQPYIIYST